jgi:hypothetical protein
MAEQDKQHMLRQKPPITGSDDIEADADLGDSIAQEFGKYSRNKAKLESDRVQPTTQKAQQEKEAIIGSNDIIADTDLGEGGIEQEFGKYSAHKAKLHAEIQENEEPLSTDQESDQTRTDINAGAGE